MPDTTVIVLDPGHGGKNEGLHYNGFLEKDMNLVVAQSMRDALLQFDDVEVYITNPEKKDMSLKERAQFAESVGADVIISLHFNMSEEHAMYGSEAWIPSVGLGNSKMHALGDIFMDQFAELGLTVRGVKTRLNDEGLDYYGIIRESAALGIPCVLVEHAYADHSRDYGFIDTKDDWKSLGNLDAQAAAKFFGLKSSSLGTDYTSFVKNGYFAPEVAVGSDKTEPENAVLMWLEGENFLIGATEEESGLVYYDYSCDGGQTWSSLFPFARDMTQMEIQIPQVQPGSRVVARIYNGHYLYKQTNFVEFEPMPEEADETSQAQTADSERGTPGEETRIESAQAQSSRVGKVGILFSGFGLFLSLMLFLAAYATYRMGGRARTHKRERMLFIAGLCVMVIAATGMFLSMSTRTVQTARQQDWQDSADIVTESREGEAEQAERAEDPIEPSPDMLKLLGENGAAGDLPQQVYTGMAAQESTVIYDIAEGFLRVPLLDTVPKNPYELSGFSGTDLQMRYNGGSHHALLGIDVSKFQGSIDWEAVAQAGVQFAVIRLGLRGYGSGELNMDERFYANLEGAKQQGLRAGVYFFSAAVDEQEAIEEADYVLQAIQGYEIDMPIVFDTEPIYYDNARTDGLTPNQLTAITRAFCNRIKEAGYTPMIYANAKRYTTVLHLDQLSEYELWLADYRQAPDFPYSFKMWQFTESGSVPGIGGAVDIDLYFEENPADG